MIKTPYKTHVAKKRVKNLRALAKQVSPKRVEGITLGTAFKGSPFGCPNSKCWCCMPDKSPQSIRADIIEQELIKEYNQV